MDEVRLGRLARQVKSLKVGGLVYRVVRNDVAMEAADFYGSTAGLTSTIMVRHDIDARVLVLTLLHETLHAIANVYMEGFKPTEQAVGAIAQGLFQVLVDNPKFTRTIGVLAER